SGASELVEQGFVLQELNGVCGHFIHIGYFTHEARLAVDVDFGEATGVGRNDGDFAGHSLEGCEAETFFCRRDEEEVADGEYFLDGFLLSEEADVITQAERAAHGFEGGAFGAIAYEK